MARGPLISSYSIFCFTESGDSVGTQIDTMISMGSYAKKWSDVSIKTLLFVCPSICALCFGFLLTHF